MNVARKKVIKPNELLKEIKEDYSNKLDKVNEEFNSNLKKNEELYKEIQQKADYYKRTYKFDIYDYEEYNQNAHLNGKLLDAASTLYRNAKVDTEVLDWIRIVKYAQTLKPLQEYSKMANLYRKIIDLSLVQFRELMKMYYFEVQRQMIVNGYGYRFQGHIGTVVINRCKNRVSSPIVDTKATKANIEKLKKEGVELYNAEKEAFCKLHNLEYKGVDPRVWTVHDYLYEFCLLWSGLRSSHFYKFEPVDTWAKSLRGKTKEDFKKEANGNLNYICNLEITFRTKITLCNEIDNTLYVKFIRNENQTPITANKTGRQSRE